MEYNLDAVGGVVEKLNSSNLVQDGVAGVINLRIPLALNSNRLVYLTYHVVSDDRW